MEACSNFVTNSYGESFDSSCEKIMSPCPEQVSPQLKSKQGVLKRKWLVPLCNQTVNLETDAKTLYYSLLKLKYSPSINLKHKKD